MHLSRPSRTPLALAVLAAALVLCTHGPSASPSTEEYLQLRVRQGGADTFITAPRALLEQMARTPTGTTVSLGQLKGKDVRLSVDRLLRDLVKVPAAAPGEVHLLTRANDLGAVFFFGSPVRKPASARQSASLLDFDLTRKGVGGGDTHLKLPLFGASTVLQTLINALGVQPDSDLGPLFDSFLGAARALGTGPALWAASPDANIAVSLE